MKAANCRASSDKWQNLRHILKTRPYFWISALAFWIFWIWIAANTPYGLDDWKWGIPLGIEELVTASLNSRYVGNALEVIVSRSFLLKTLLMGTMETLIPLLSVLLVQRWRETEGEAAASDCFLVLMLVLANLVYLTLPQIIRAQTYGWVAGFSNYGLAAFLLVLSQGILLDGKDPTQKHGLGFFVVSMFVGLITQLVLENITIFMVALAVFAVLIQLFTYKRCSMTTIAFLLGVVLGALIMFSGNIYSSLLTTGHTEGVGRYLSYPVDMKLIELIPFLYYRSLYLLPGNLWGNNWLACSVIALCMPLAAEELRPVLRKAVNFVCLCFFLFFVFNRFVGPIENYFSRWSDVLSQRLHFLFFWVVLFLTFFLFRRQKNTRCMLLLLWLLSPLAIAPMAAVTSIPGRCFLPTIVFLTEYCLLLFHQEAKKIRPTMQKVGIVILVSVLLVSMTRMTIIHTSLGIAEKQREALISEAKKTQATSLYLPDYPFEYEHFITEPLKGGEQMLYFREFYQIPENTELLFDPIDD